MQCELNETSTLAELSKDLPGYNVTVNQWRKYPVSRVRTQCAIQLRDGMIINHNPFLTWMLSR